MSQVLTDNQNYQDIADAIRAQGVAGTFQPSQMADAIGRIAFSAENIRYNDGTVADALDNIVTDFTEIWCDQASVANNTVTSLGSITLSKGIWLVVVNASWDSHSTGHRIISLEATANSSKVLSSRMSGVAAAAANGQGNYQEYVRIINVTATSGTYYLNVRQNSGSALNSWGYISAVKLKS